MNAHRYESRFMRRAGRASGEDFARRLTLLRLIDRFEEMGSDAEVYLPLNHAARVLGQSIDQVVIDLAHISESKGSLNWFTVQVRGVRVAVISTGGHMVDAGNELFDRVYARLLSMGLIPATSGRAA